MFRIKEKIKEELKEVSIKTWIIFFISLLLVTYFIISDNNKIKLLIGGLFLIIHGLVSVKNNQFAALFEIISGLMALLTIMLPKQPLWYLVIFYLLMLLMLLGFFYIHRKMRLYAVEKKLKLIYHFLSLLFFLLIGMIVITMMKSAILFGFQIPLSITDYIFLIQLSLISLITFFLLIDNIILIIPERIREVLIGRQYSVAHSVFLSLCLTILIGGYFYINATDNPVLQKVILVLGAAFFTSLIISDTLKSLFK